MRCSELKKDKRKRRSRGKTESGREAKMCDAVAKGEQSFQEQEGGIQQQVMQ